MGNIAAPSLTRDKVVSSAIRNYNLWNSFYLLQYSISAIASFFDVRRWASQVCKYRKLDIRDFTYCGIPSKVTFGTYLGIS